MRNLPSMQKNKTLSGQCSHKGQSGIFLSRYTMEVHGAFCSCPPPSWRGIHPIPMTRISFTRFAKGWRGVCFPLRMTCLISEFFKTKNGHETPSQSSDFDDNLGKSYCGTRRVHLRPPRGPGRQTYTEHRPGKFWEP